MEKLNLKNMWGSEYEISIHTSNYANNGNLYIGMDCWEDIGNGEYPEPYGDLTVNLDIKCKPNCAFIDTNNNGKEIMDWLVANKLGKFTGKWHHNGGFCIYPEFEFDMNEVQKYVE
jgi:hypothetical protein